MEMGDVSLVLMKGHNRGEKRCILKIIHISVNMAWVNLGL